MTKNLMSIDTALLDPLRNKFLTGLEIRSLIYKTISVGFLYPDDAWQKRMLGLIGELDGLSDSSKATEIFKTVEDDTAKVHGFLSPTSEYRNFQNRDSSASPQNDNKRKCHSDPERSEGEESNLVELQTEHFRLFGPDPLCHLDISHWTQGDVFMQSRKMAEMAGFYRAFGLDMNEGLRVDNLSIVFEFLSYLCIKILHALEIGDDDKIEITEKAFDSFRNEFVLPGLDRFVKSIKYNSRTGFYETLGELAEKIMEDK